MIRRLPSRNSRSKGLKVKNVLQIFVLLAVCFWLIYQVKHSHDKKEEFDEKDAKDSVRTQTGNGVLKLGRKDPRHQTQDAINDDKHEEDEEEFTTLEDLLKFEKEHEERTKQKEDQQEERIEEKEGEEKSKNTEEDEQEEEETTIRDMEDEGRVGGDDELDEHAQGKTAETNHEEDSIDEEKESEEEVEEKEIESNVGKDKGVAIDQETSTDDPDHDDVGENSQEAREEHYKADDASSAVTHHTQIIGSEVEKETVDNSNENSARNDLEVNNANDNIGEEYNGYESKLTVEVGQGQIPDSSPSLNVTTNDKNGVIAHTIVEDQTPQNAASTSLTSNQTVLSINPTETNAEAGNGNNSTWRGVDMSNSLQSHEKVAVTDSPAENITVHGKRTGEITNLLATESEKVDHSSSEISDGIVKTQVVTETEVNSGASEKFGTADSHSVTNDTATLPVVKNESGKTDEMLDASSGSREEVALTNDPIDSSDLQLAKEARIDPVTLPDTTTTERDAAAQ